MPIDVTKIPTNPPTTFQEWLESTSIGRLVLNSGKAPPPKTTAAAAPARLFTMPRRG
jgi:hypothetical protein